MKDTEISQGLRWISCCKGRKCPEIAIDDANTALLVKDDFGTIITVPLHEAYDLAETIEEVLAQTRYQPSK